MPGLSSILSLFFCNVFNKFNNTGGHMLGSIYHMTLKLLKNHSFDVKISLFFTRCNNGRNYATLLNL